MEININEREEIEREEARVSRDSILWPTSTGYKAIFLSYSQYTIF
jgi:hypothetical protein